MRNVLRRQFLAAAVLFLAAAGALEAQLSKLAYRELGQADLSQNGLNRVQGVELFQPLGLALDARGGQVHVYIADSGNSRILAWADARTYQLGSPPALILGQPGPQYSNANGIGVKGLNNPVGLAVDSVTGNLYVADFGNNRVVRFPSPFANPARVEPDLVYGEPDFNTRTANAGGISKHSMNQPRAVAVDPGGNLWVADSGNNRVLRFNAASLNSLTPPDADTVIGQPDFLSGGNSVSGSSFDLPAGLTFDQQGNLYVADFNNLRVLKFSAPFAPGNSNPSASVVWGQGSFTSRQQAAQPSASTLNGPLGLAVDSSGSLYVAVATDNRVLIFPPASGTGSGASAKSVLGQADFTSVKANGASAPLASPSVLSSPADVKVDSNGNVYVADAGNNRVLMLPAGAKSATAVWGQNDFTSNGVNEIKPSSLNAPYKAVVDYSQAPYALYISDTGNNRVLGWKDSVKFQSGDPADLVIGQPSFLTGASNVDTQGSATPSATSLSGPTGLAVDANGNLFVADTNNNRVLRFPRPVNQAGRIMPDAVIGQTDFSSATSAAVSTTSLHRPFGLAIGPDGDLFVADAANNRVLEFRSNPGTNAAALRVYGQPNFNSSVTSSQLSAQTLTTPAGIYVDSASNLYVADSGANRVLIFPDVQSAPAAGAVAAFVIGKADFTGTSSSGASFKTPVDVAVDNAGNIYVSDEGDNRVLLFPSLIFLPVSGATATSVTGQDTVSGTAANWDSTNGLATPDGLVSPLGIFLDRQGTLYVADGGNNRVLQFLKPAVVVNAATFQAGFPISPGAAAVLFGNGITSGGASTAPAGSLPASMLNLQVMVNDVLTAPLYYAGPTQVNFQFPSNSPLGTDRIAIRTADTGELIAGGSVTVASVSPGLFTLAQNGSGPGAILNQDNTLNSASSPALRGSTIQIFGTGQGQVSPPVQDGAPASSSPLSSTVAVPTSNPTTCVTSQPSICVAVGSSFGGIGYSGLAPGYVGLWQINVVIPADVTPGSAVPVRVLLNGTTSNTVTVAVR